MLSNDVYNHIITMYRQNLEKDRNKGRKDCITILKSTLTEAYKMSGFSEQLPIKGEKITDDIRRLISHRFINQLTYYYPVTYAHKITMGNERPISFETLNFDDFAQVDTTCNGENPGMSAKILSLMDGYHAVMILACRAGESKKVLYLDNNQILDFYDSTVGKKKLLEFISNYVKESWDKMYDGGKGVSFKTETILARLNLFDFLV